MGYGSSPILQSNVDPAFSLDENPITVFTHGARPSFEQSTRSL